MRITSASFQFKISSLPFCALLDGKELKIQMDNFYCFLYESETWDLWFKEQCRLMVFENGALRMVFGPGRKQVKSR